MDVENILQAVALGVDVIFLGFLHRSYQTASTYATALKEAEQLDIDQLKKLSQPKIRSHSFWKFWRSKPKQEDVIGGDRCYYACIRGKAEAADKAQLLKSSDGQSSGVIYKILTKEIAAVWSAGRFWYTKERTVKEVNREIPWVIKSQTPGSKSFVHVIDGLSADMLDITTVRDEFVPSPFSLSAWIGGWLAGQQVQGIQEVEEMLEAGSLITAVGEIIVSTDGTIKLRSPASSEMPFILTSLSHSDLLENYETLAAFCKWGFFILGGVGLMLIFSLARKWLSSRNVTTTLRTELDILNELRSARTSEDNEEDMPEWQRCVVCLSRAREVIVLPCGHVCLCADCMILMNDRYANQRLCPMCRAPIEQIARAFVP